MKPESFELFSSIFRQRAGAALGREKAYLMESQLQAVLRKHNVKTLDELATLVRNRREESLLQDVTRAMNCTETSFNRDYKAFASFRRHLLPKLVREFDTYKHLRIWSAGTSSGQEAYSLAIMCAEETALLEGWRVDILGTDFSREMIERAKQGIYTQFEAQHGLPIQMLLKYFKPVGNGNWQANDVLRSKIVFREGNLLQEMPAANSFHVIFCRHVIDVFDFSARIKVLGGFQEALIQNGVLALSPHDRLSEAEGRFYPFSGAAGLYVGG